MKRANELHLSWDPETEVAYLRLADTGDADMLGPTLLLENDPEFAGAVALDFTVADGRVVGLEFQMASACSSIDPRHLAGRRRQLAATPRQA